MNEKKMGIQRYFWIGNLNNAQLTVLITDLVSSSHDFLGSEGSLNYFLCTFFLHQPFFRLIFRTNVILSSELHRFSKTLRTFRLISPIKSYGLLHIVGLPVFPYLQFVPLFMCSARLYKRFNDFLKVTLRIIYLINSRLGF